MKNKVKLLIEKIKRNKVEVFRITLFSTAFLSALLILYTASITPSKHKLRHLHNRILISNLEETETPKVETNQEASKKEEETNDNSRIENNPSSNWWSYPTEIKEVTKSGDDLLVLVNKEYKLPSSYIPSNTVQMSSKYIRLTKTMYIRSLVSNDLEALGKAASEDNIDLSIVSAYRSYATQENTYNFWLNSKGGNQDETDKISARAGHSQHQLGTTVDFSSSEVGDNIGSIFHNTKAALWLEENAWKYGFVLAYPQGQEEITGYSYESWHYRYIGVKNAALWKQSGQILEMWLKELN